MSKSKKAVVQALDSAQLRLKALLNSTETSPSSDILSIKQALDEIQTARRELRALQRARQAVPDAASARGLQILDSISDCCVITTPDGIIIEINRAATQLFRRTRVSLLNKSINELVLDKEKSLPAALHKLNESVSEVEWQGTLRRAHETPFAASVKISCLNGAPAQLFWLIRDLSEIQTAEKAKQRSEFLAYAGQLLSASPEFAARLERITRLAVPAFADLCIVHVRDPQGQTAKIQVAHTDPTKEQELTAIETQRMNAAPPPATANSSPRDTRKFAARVTDDLLNDIAYADEHLPALRGLGLKSYISVPLKTHGRSFGAIVFATAESGRVYEQDDLIFAETFARRAALALENALRYEESQSALAERDRALALALKEIKIPLNVMVNLTQLVKTRLSYVPTMFAAPNGARSPDEILENHLEDITRAGERLLSMLNDLSELARIQNQSLKLHPVWFNLSELVRSVADSMRSLQAEGRYPRDVKLRVHVPDSPQISLYAAEERIAQVLTNLFDNALRYSPRGGAVDVELDVTGSTDVPEAMSAHILIRDQGIGVPPAEQERIFQPFVRATNTLEQNISGIGIGLALCQEIITRHEGQIWVESAGNNHGSAFHIMLPKIELEAL